MTGNRVAHPLLLSLANIHAEIRVKSSYHAFLLLALFPCPKFLYPVKAMRGPLENRVIHRCLDIICAPLKIAAKLGRMMADPLGHMRLCYTPLAVYIADTPEACMLTGVAGLTSHMTLANYKQFGDSFRHEPRCGSTTLAQINALTETVDPWDLQAYHKAALNTYRLNTVHLPFWRDWPLSDPLHCMAPEPLHHWHKFFWDHEAQWCILVVGDLEINFRFSIIQPRTGFRHFAEGIAGIKQATGRVHRDVQRLLIATIAGAAPSGFVIAVRALMDFRYLAQMQVIDETTLTLIDDALKEFHRHKHHILNAGARRGAKNNVINDFQIPKLELLHSVVPSVRLIGPAIQWTADTTEHCNITEIKEPAHAGNNKNYETQICQTLDRAKKCRFFDIATSLLESNQVLDGSVSFESDDSDEDDPIKDQPLGIVQPPDAHKKPVDYFAEAQRLIHSPPTLGPLPLRTFSTQSTAFHLNSRPSKTSISVDDAAALFVLPDLRPALADHVNRLQHGLQWVHCIGGRRSSPPNAILPFKNIQIWYNVRMQMKAAHDLTTVQPSQVVHASPPSLQWPHGYYETALVSNVPQSTWPGSGLSG